MKYIDNALIKTDWNINGQRESIKDKSVLSNIS
jgi:hypothetical protein